MCEMCQPPPAEAPPMPDWSDPGWLHNQPDWSDDWPAGWDDSGQKRYSHLDGFGGEGVHDD